MGAAGGPAQSGSVLGCTASTTLKLFEDCTMVPDRLSHGSDEITAIELNDPTNVLSELAVATARGTSFGVVAVLTLSERIPATLRVPPPPCVWRTAMDESPSKSTVTVPLSVTDGATKLLS